MSNVTQVCMDSLGNRVFVTNGNATSGYTNCSSFGASGTVACAGAYSVALTATGLGSTAVSGTLSLSQPSSGAFTVSGTLSGVTAGQTITISIPLTGGTTGTVSVAATGTTITVNNSVAGTPASGGTVTVGESGLTSGSVAQGTIVAGCNGSALGAALQLCTDSRGNRVLMPNGGATTSYTNCGSAPPPPGNGFGGGPWMGGGPMGFGGPGVSGGPMSFGGPRPSLTRCTDGQGNTVLVRTGGSTTGHTNCTTQ